MIHDEEWCVRGFGRVRDGRGHHCRVHRGRVLSFVRSGVHVHGRDRDRFTHLLASAHELSSHSSLSFYILSSK